MLKVLKGQEVLRVRHQQEPKVLRVPKGDKVSKEPKVGVDLKVHKEPKED